MLVFCLAAVAAAPGAALAAVEFVADANHDGKVSVKEYLDNRWSFLKRGDNNKDNRLSKPEWDQEAAQLRTWLEADGIKDASIIGKGGGFQKMDTNVDGFVTQAESDAYWGARFVGYDANKDGFISAAEAETAMKMAKP
jgi:hypothetical protein